ncbi:hypothetical protein OF376_00305 [Ureaplasma miroungigenitalium]|uniref:Lipoprotein n=1 Tax=Ureaplasma miroungigenitalium TaxID=1042321 RepID=A0ABT3BMH6_9BACT|nr:hypothetical protein [Ureaplasma miroungigenitalium]MCV3728232.1 hypothetical protein [Ureaplasma miroungigenitalium]MCV3734036.1 hypothetical protein [Ureaplasma miroungigenitalium]
MNKTRKSWLKKITGVVIGCAAGLVGVGCVGFLTACSPYKKYQFDTKNVSIQKINERYVLVVNNALLNPDNNKLSEAMIMKTTWKVALEKAGEQTYEVRSQPTNVSVQQVNGHYFLSCQVDLGAAAQINHHLQLLKQASPDKEQFMLIVPDQHFISMQIAFNYYE